MEPNNQPLKNPGLQVNAFFKNNRKLVISVGILAFAVLALVLSLIPFFKKEQIKKELSTKKETSSIDLETKYDNPFDKSAQYVNPFSSYKNPFDNLK